MNQAVPLIVPERCARSRTPRSPCNRCAEACPRDIVTLQPEGIALASGCDGCGACVAACPCGALALPADDGAALPDRLPRDRDALVVACDRAGEDSPDILLPCLAALPVHLPAALATRGIRTLELRSGTCDACDRSPAAREIPRALERGLAWQRLTGRPLQVRRTNRPGAGGGGLGMTRRGMFAMLRRRLGPREQALGAPPHEVLWSVLATASPLPEVPDPPVTWTDLRVGPSCNGCRVCREVCPTGAIERWEESGQIEIRFDPLRCHGCGNCVACCLPKAASLQSLPASVLIRKAADFPKRGPGVSLREVRARRTIRPCPTCGLPHAGEDDLCFACQARRARMSGT